MDGQHSVTDWIANIVLMSIGVFNRLVFGNDKLTKKQLIAFYIFCIGVAWIVSKLQISDIIKSGIMLCIGLIALNFIKAVIKGSNKSEKKASDKISKQLDKLID